MKYQTITENGKVKYVVLPVELFETLLDRLEDESDRRAIREAKKEPLYEQEEAEEYIFMNPVKRERLERGWTQKELAERLAVKQSTVLHSFRGWPFSQNVIGGVLYVFHDLAMGETAATEVKGRWNAEWAGMPPLSNHRKNKGRRHHNKATP
jgi:hypothetical protein